jgi:2-polyprenyl-3-methyl-5-hydroxy-6-metoxy-1,4-benzoquinol methylase
MTLTQDRSILSIPKLSEAVRCPLCNSGKADWDLKAQTLGAGLFEGELFSVYRCRVCQIGITDPVPAEDESKLLYEERTSNDFQVDDNALTSSLKDIAADRDVRTFLRHARLRHSTPKMLDYACGNGSFALAMRRVFPDNSVYATDYHADAPAMLRGSEVRYVGYAGLSEQAPFDFILCRHVLEHTYDPVGFLSSLAALISADGVLMIEVPNLEAPLARAFGKHWDGYYAPYHPIHFSATALERSVTLAGFVAEKAAGCEMPKMGRSLRNVIGCEYNPLLFTAGVLLHPVQLAAKTLTGEATCLRLWARKPKSPAEEMIC